MKDCASLRKLMVAAGLLAAMTIAVAPVFQTEADRAIIELKAENGHEADGPRVEAASSEAITPSQAVEVESANPYIFQEFLTVGETPSPVRRLIALPVSGLKALLRSVISPQAP